MPLTANSLYETGTESVDKVRRTASKGLQATEKSKTEREDLAQGKKVKVKRLQINLSQRAYDRLLLLQGRTGAITVADVVREALRVYDALVDEVGDGKRIVLESDDKPNEREIVLLF